MITKADIEKRLAELRARLEQVMANANAINGAIEDCEYWLEKAEDKTSDE